ncbi:MAG: helix-turn-helix domain-containing protein [Candidatus Margulisbacteria bacterium]|jgi:transcriptional regulator with XRE-family HTH domain|nr:helix-turn-helix domain-containing protein [Candidatus Margulisiibacteriota bacterium]
MDINVLKKIISQKLAFLLKYSGKTIEATAYELGMDFSQYYRLLKGQRLPMLPTLLRVNKLYGVDMNWWFVDIGKAARPVIRHSGNPLEYQLVNSFKKLSRPAQKTAVSMLKAMARNLKA